jgi:hypothetical protein
VIGNSIDHLGVDDNRIKCNQIGDEETDHVPLVENLEQGLLLEWNASQSKLNRQRILIWFFEESMTKRIKDLDGASDDLKNFFFGQ